MKIGLVIRRNPLLLALAAAAAAVMLFISEGSYFRSVSTLNALGAMATARSSLQGLERSFLDAETGQRGYLLTGRASTFSPMTTHCRTSTPPSASCSSTTPTNPKR